MKEFKSYLQRQKLLEEISQKVYSILRERQEVIEEDPQLQYTYKHLTDSRLRRFEELRKKLKLKNSKNLKDAILIDFDALESHENSEIVDELRRLLDVEKVRRK